jgi:O-antigen ligase
MNPISNELSRKNALFLFAFATVPVLGLFCFYFFLSIAILKLAALGLAALILSCLLFAHPKFSFFVAIFYVYAGLSFYFHFHLSYPIVMIAFFAVLLRHFISDPIEMPDQMFNWSVALFTMIALTSMLYARSIDFFLLGFGKYLKVLILTFLAMQLLRKPGDLEKYAYVIFLGSIMAVLFGLVNLKLGLAKDLSVVVFAKATRFEATHVNPNRLAIYLVSALPLGLYATKRAKRIHLRILLAVCSFASILAIFASFSRAAIFPLIFVLIATLVREVKSKKVYAGFFLLIMVVVLITPSFYWTRVLSIGELLQDLPSDWSIYMRLQAAKVAVNLISQHPLTGVGLSNFRANSGAYMYLPLVAHNSYLEILVGVGIFGFIAWFCIILSGVRGCLRGLRHRWDSSTTWMSSLSFYLLLSFISALMNGMFLTAEFGYFIWIPLAGGLVAGNMVRRHIDTQHT